MVSSMRTRLQQLIPVVLSVCVVASGCSKSGTDERASVSSSTTNQRVAVSPRSPGCSSPSKPAEAKTKVTLDVAGSQRWFYLTVPSTLGTSPAPLILDFHGYAEGADIHYMASEMATYGPAHGAIVVTPSGQSDPVMWNSTSTPELANDVEFVQAILGHVEGSLCVDMTRVYSIGMSNGGFMSERLVCEMADSFAAVALVASMAEHKSCSPSRSVPMLAIHGTADTFVPFEGDDRSGAQTLEITPTAKIMFGGLKPETVRQAATAWAPLVGCDPTAPTPVPLTSDATIEKWNCGDAARALELIVVNGGGHSWPGSDFYGQVAATVGKTSMTFDANEVIWNFLSNYSLPSA